MISVWVVAPAVVVLYLASIKILKKYKLRTGALKVPAQDVVTRDNVTVKVNAVIFFRVADPRLAVLEVPNLLYATSQLAQTTLRSVLGEAELDELLSQRGKLPCGSLTRKRRTGPDWNSPGSSTSRNSGHSPSVMRTAG